MGFNYLAAGEFADHVHALAIIESGEDDSKVGDDGVAKGLLQQHPDFFVNYYKPKMDVLESWATAQIKAAANFLSMWEPSLTIDGAIQAYHLGIGAYRREGKRDVDYLTRWSDAFQRVRSAKT